MFTWEQVSEIHDRLGSAQTFLQYVQALAAVGVERCDTYLIDGHSEYFGKDGHAVKSPAVHEEFAVAETSNRDGLLEHLRLHEQRKTGYLEMSKGLADSGVEKWSIDTAKLTMTFCDRMGEPLLIEALKP
jgi:uncharacterized protein YbcV (DUF1398 family)